MRSALPLLLLCSLFTQPVSAQYCVPTFLEFDTEDFYIHHVSMDGNVNSSPGPGSPNYEDFSAPAYITYMARGTTYYVNAQFVADDQFAAQASISVWVDFDGNGVFAHPAERVGVTGVSFGDDIYGFDLTIPVNAALGPTRIRFLLGEVPTNVLPCAQGIEQGQCEDYTLMIVDDVPDVPPVADFSASIDTLPNGGGFVDFFDESTETPYLWSWYFEGGTPSTSTAQNPQNIFFATEGCHLVELTATNNVFPNTVTRTCEIYVDAPNTDCVELYISEYVEGSANNKALELYNSTNADLDPDGYRLLLFTNGATIANSYVDLAGTLPHHGTVVIVNPQADAAFLAMADLTHAVCGFNGDDAVELRKNNVPIDVIGVVGVDPGSNWPVGTGSTANRTLVRKVQVTSPNTDWATGASEWDVYSEDDISHLGAHAGTCGSTTDVASTVRATALRLFPVPASDVLVIEQAAALNARVLLHVLTVQGSVVLESQATGTQHALDINSLAPGQYVLRQITTDGTQVMARFSVVR